MFVLIVRNIYNDRAIEAAGTLSHHLDAKGLYNMTIDSTDELLGVDSHRRHEFWQKLAREHPGIGTRGAAPDDSGIPDGMLVVVLGGDGTILRSARLVQNYDIPILGINFGHLGFLANKGEDGVVGLVQKALEGRLVMEERTNLDIQVELAYGSGDNGPHDPSVTDVASDGKEANRYGFFALNELVVGRGSQGSTVSYSLDISGVHMADVLGDGVIIATSTGSTAYALAAGGPLVNPAYEGMIVQPLAPHTLTARAVLTDRDDVVCVDVSKMRDGRHATLFADGDALQFKHPVSRIFIKRGRKKTHFLYAREHHFYRYAADVFFNQ